MESSPFAFYDGSPVQALGRLARDTLLGECRFEGSVFGMELEDGENESGELRATTCAMERRVRCRADLAMALALQNPRRTAKMCETGYMRLNIERLTLIPTLQFLWTLHAYPPAGLRWNGPCAMTTHLVRVHGNQRPAYPGSRTGSFGP